MERMLTTKEVAQILSITQGTVLKLLKRGVLKGIKIGRIWRISSKEIEKLIGTQISEIEKNKKGGCNMTGDKKSSIPEIRLQE